MSSLPHRVIATQDEPAVALMRHPRSAQRPPDAQRLPGARRRFHADNPALTLFHCHQQLRMDFGFMALFEYV